MRQVHQHGAAGDQTRATVNHPVEDAEPGEPEWQEMNWQLKKTFPSLRILGLLAMLLLSQNNL